MQVEILNRKIVLHRNYLILTILLFIAEVFIAAFAKGFFIRGVFGDYLVVMLMYCAIRTLAKLSIAKTAVMVLLLAYFIEFLQAIDFLSMIGVKKNLATDLILGSSFAWEDIYAYTLGVLTVLLIEFMLRKKHNTT